jgi:hypothetical protein
VLRKLPAPGKGADSGMAWADGDLDGEVWHGVSDDVRPAELRRIGADGTVEGKGKRKERG